MYILARVPCVQGDYGDPRGGPSLSLEPNQGLPLRPAWSNGGGPICSQGSSMVEHRTNTAAIPVRLRALAPVYTCPVRLAVRTPDFHSGNSGSNPLRDTSLHSGPYGLDKASSPVSRLITGGQFDQQRRNLTGRLRAPLVVGAVKDRVTMGTRAGRVRNRLLVNLFSREPPGSRNRETSLFTQNPLFY